MVPSFILYIIESISGAAKYNKGVPTPVPSEASANSAGQDMWVLSNCEATFLTPLREESGHIIICI